jgi:hypothetical protein
VGKLMALDFRKTNTLPFLPVGYYYHLWWS